MDTDTEKIETGKMDKCTLTPEDVAEVGGGGQPTRGEPEMPVFPARQNHDDKAMKCGGISEQAVNDRPNLIADSKK